ncbi:MAG: hypothetical protein K0S10_395, partial [Rubrobacteraceae bacterium]|nr:hypothetical protein [Rubrobacteraceae bacterium]
GVAVREKGEPPRHLEVSSDNAPLHLDRTDLRGRPPATSGSRLFAGLPRLRWLLWLVPARRCRGRRRRTPGAPAAGDTKQEKHESQHSVKRSRSAVRQGATLLRSIRPTSPDYMPPFSLSVSVGAVREPPPHNPSNRPSRPRRRRTPPPEGRLGPRCGQPLYSSARRKPCRRAPGSSRRRRLTRQP